MLKVPEIDCNTALTQLWDYLDHELTPERMASVRLHLERCSHCLPHARFAERFLDALHRCHGECQMPDGLRSKVVERLKGEGLTS